MKETKDELVLEIETLRNENKRLMQLLLEVKELIIKGN